VAAAVFKSLVATCLMCGAGVLLVWKMAELPDTRLLNVVRLAVVVPACGTVYVLAARLIRAHEVSLILGRPGKQADQS
jgi:hypothetical protein